MQRKIKVYSNTKMKTIEDILVLFHPLEGEYTPKDVETALDSFNIVDVLTTYTPEDRPQTENKGVDTNVVVNATDLPLFQNLNRILEKVVKSDESKKVELNAKIRRKVKRLLEIISEVITKNTPKKPEVKPIIQQKPTNPKETAEEEERNPDHDALTADKNLVALIEKVATSTNAADLETNLAAVKPGIGNTYSRRKLKRLIEQLVAKPEIESSTNAKVRRRVTRVLKILSPGGESSTNDANNNDSTLKQSPSEGADEKAGRKRKLAAISVPHIVFIGQLPYTCTEEDLRLFFQQNNIKGEMKVRLLTDARTKESKGMAFVEFNTLEDMNTALLLHHAVFMNRKINIEKSCGGKDVKKRKEMIEQQKVKQQKTIEFTFQQLFDDYSEKRVLNPDSLGKEFKAKLMGYSPLILSKVSITSRLMSELLMFIVSVLFVC